MTDSNGEPPGANGPTADGPEACPRRGLGPYPGTRRQPPRGGGRPGGAAAAQQQLMARIAAGRKARQQRAVLVVRGLLSALVLLASGTAWAITT